jgi:hypothetical protein
MYSYTTLADELRLAEKTRAKGVARATKRSLLHRHYRAQLLEPVEQRNENLRIGSQRNILYTFRTMKRGLSCYDDKRVLRSDNISSWSWGHKDIPARICALQGSTDLGPDPQEQIPAYVQSQEDEGKF